MHLVGDAPVGRRVVRALVQLLTAAATGGGGDPRFAVPPAQQDGRVLRERGGGAILGLAPLVVRHRVREFRRPDRRLNGGVWS